MSARPMNTDRHPAWMAPGQYCGVSLRPLSGAPEIIGFFNPATGERFMRAGTHGKSIPRHNISSLLARAERAILAREKAIARYKAACACALVGLDFVLLKGLRERRVDRCARLVRESYAEIAALVDGWRDLYLQVSGGSR